MAFARRLLSTSFVPVIALFGPLALAATAAAEGPPVVIVEAQGGVAAPVVVVAAPPPPSRIHDGLYLRAALGGGGLTDNFHGPLGWVSGSASGPSGAGELAIGFALRRGLAIGGMLTVDWVANPVVEVEGVTVSNDVAVGALTMLGPFLDWYTNPDRGFHLQAFVGGARITMEDSSGTRSDPSLDPVGAGLAIGAGWELRLGRKWGLGVLGRLTGAQLSQNGRHSVFAASLLVSLTAF